MVKFPDCGKKWSKTSRSKSNRYRDCRIRYDREWRARRKAAGHPVISTKMPRSYHALYEASYYQRPEVKAKRAEFQRRRYRDATHQQRVRARMDLRNAVRRGELKKPSCCDSCGTIGRLAAHHDDYSRALDVRWLCRPCHRSADAKAEGQ